MTAAPLASPDDVADLWRPLTSTEVARITNLVVKASSLLRQRLPQVDARIARFKADPTDGGGLDPMAVATIVATVVKRFLVNPDGATNTSETQGPYSSSKGFALRGDKDIRGELIVLESDVASLLEPSTAQARLATLRVKAGMSPDPQNYGVTEGSVAAGGFDPGVDGWITRDPGY
jgi:hypothetical protein